MPQSQTKGLLVVVHLPAAHAAACIYMDVVSMAVEMFDAGDALKCRAVLVLPGMTPYAQIEFHLLVVLHQPARHALAEGL